MSKPSIGRSAQRAKFRVPRIPSLDELGYLMMCLGVILKALLPSLNYRTLNAVARRLEREPRARRAVRRSVGRKSA